MRYDGLLHEISESKMRGKPTKGRRIQMLHDLANDGGFVHSNRQLRIQMERHRKDVKNLLYSTRLQTMMSRKCFTVNSPT